MEHENIENDVTEKAHIENWNLRLRLQNDLKRYDMIYIQAPFGWGKHMFLKDFEKSHPKWNFCYLDGRAKESLSKQIEPFSKTSNRIWMIDALEKIFQSKEEAVIWELLAKKKNHEKFIFASTILLPDQMLPYVVSHHLVVYRVDELKPSNEDVYHYFQKKGIELSKEDLLKIEKDFHNMPLCLYMLENLLRNSQGKYSHLIKEQCVRDLYAYFDVTFFHSFTLEEQDALLKLSCFELISKKLAQFILKIPDEKIAALFHSFLSKGSVFKPAGEGEWQFYSLFKGFLRRAVNQYLDLEEALNLYSLAMDYFQGQEDYFSALRFASLLGNWEQMAIFLNQILQKQVEYDTFLLLEEYFLQLSIVYLKRYPRLLAAVAVLESINGDLEKSAEYRRKLMVAINECPDEDKKVEMMRSLLSMELAIPGPVTPEELKANLEYAHYLQDRGIHMIENGLKPSCASILHGDKDWTILFENGVHLFESIIKQYSEPMTMLFGNSKSTMLYFTFAEVYYEYNQLDEALKLVSRSLDEARIHEDQRMLQLCNMKLVDIMMVKNQLDSAEIFLVRQLGESLEGDKLCQNNFMAHSVLLDLLKGDAEKVSIWMEKRAPDESSRFRSICYYQYLIKIKVYIWQEQYVLARLILQSLLDFSENYGMYYLGIQVRVLKAVLDYREEKEEWEQTLLEALQRGKSCYFIRVFADEGAAVYEMLQKLVQKIKDTDLGKDRYLKEVLYATRAQMLLYPNYLRKRKEVNPKIFSCYEKDVMRLLSLGEKNSEIAQMLDVSENTVKYHLKNIYQKLGVKNRVQAIKLISDMNLS